MTEHTELPWKVDKPPVGYTYSITDAPTVNIIVATHLTKHDAEFIVRACKSHKNLVSKSQALLDSLKPVRIEGCLVNLTTMSKAAQQLVAAIDNAKPKAEKEPAK